MTEKLCRAFDLGIALDGLVVAPGGFSHRVWRLKTTAGTFAVKQLNPTIVARPGALDRYRATERVAAAFSASGIDAVVARDAGRDPLREIDGSWCAAYPWVDGVAVTLSDVTVDYARAVGAILGRLHRCNLSHPGLPGPSARAISADRWHDLAHRSQGQPGRHS